MYLTIKKKDSVTSILLFIFNAFLVNQGITAIPLRKIFKIMEPFQRSETSIRMALSREMQNGVLVSKKHDREVYYHLTDEALRGFAHWGKTLNNFVEKIKWQTNNWDGFWHLLIFYSSVEESRIEFIEYLSESGYGCLSNRSTWIIPYSIVPATLAKAEQLGLNKDMFIFNSQHVGSQTVEDIVEQAWPGIKELKAKYEDFHYRVIKSLSDLDKMLPTGAETLPLLHRLGQDLFEIIQDDPQLPLELLPDGWKGIDSARDFMNLRGRLIPLANEYISRILQD